MKIRLEKFEGPLELLLELIEAQKLAITDVTLAQVTDQYLEAIGQLSQLAMSELADFLVVASRLLLIKSKALLPTLQLTPDEEREVAALKFALQEYQRYKEKTKYIQERAKSNVGIVTRVLWQGRPIFFYPPKHFSVQNAQDLFSKSLAVWERFVSPKQQQVLERTISIEQKIQEIIGRIQIHVQTSLKGLVHDSKRKMDIIVAFLALLFLFRDKMVCLEQKSDADDITVTKAQCEVSKDTIHHAGAVGI